MFVWVRLDSQPSISFYSVRLAEQYITGLKYKRLVGIGDINRPLSVAGGGENSNTVFTIDNSDGSMTKYFTDPPMRVRAVIEGFYDGNVLSIFRGVVTDIDIGPEIQISLEF